MRPTAGNNPELRYNLLTGVGGIGSGMFFALEGDHTLGRNESRPAKLLDVRDYCKLHIISHYAAVLLNSERFKVVPIGKIGDDQAGSRLLEEMSDAGMDVWFVDKIPGSPTLLSICFQYPDSSGGNITTSHSAASLLEPHHVNRIEGVLSKAGSRAIALVAPEAPLDARCHLLELASKYGAFRVGAIASAEVEKARQLGFFDMIDLLAINEDEAAAIAGTGADPANIEPLLSKLGETLGEKMQIVMSAGKLGAYARSQGTWSHCPAVSAEVACTAGAGDALLSGTIVGLTGGLELIAPGSPRSSITDRPLESALDLGVLLAGFSVTSPHTIHPDANCAALLEFADKHGIELAEPVRNLLLT